MLLKGLLLKDQGRLSDKIGSSSNFDIKIYKIHIYHGEFLAAMSSSRSDDVTQCVRACVHVCVHASVVKKIKNIKNLIISFKNYIETLRYKIRC